jgi:hypothetical protein
MLLFSERVLFLINTFLNLNPKMKEAEAIFNTLFYRVYAAQFHHHL